MSENNFKDKRYVKPAMGAHEINVESGHAKQIRRATHGTTVGRLNKPIKGEWDAPKKLKTEAKYKAQAGNGVSGSEPSGTNTHASKFFMRKDGSTGMC